MNKALGEPMIQVGSPSPPATAFVYAAQARDWTSFASVPDVTIEFWSEDTTYTPAVALDGRGGFSVAVETCAQRSTVGDDLAQSILIGGEPSPCRDWRADYLMRARSGLRCSNPFGGVHGIAIGWVVWLKPCAEVGGSGLAWRRMPVR